MKVFADMMRKAPKPSVRATSPPEPFGPKEGDEVVAISLLKPVNLVLTFTAPDRRGLSLCVHLSSHQVSMYG